LWFGDCKKEILITKNNKMKSVKLTPKQKELFDLLNSTPEGVLYKHVKPTGLVCYRLLDSKRNPVGNFRQGLVEDLIDKDVLEKKSGTYEYALKATTEKIDYSNLGLVKTAV
jgi:hypothetical protein